MIKWTGSWGRIFCICGQLWTFEKYEGRHIGHNGRDKMDCPTCKSVVWSFVPGDRAPKDVKVVSGCVRVCSLEDCTEVVVGGVPGSSYRVGGSQHMVQGDGTPPPDWPLLTSGWKHTAWLSGVVPVLVCTLGRRAKRFALEGANASERLHQGSCILSESTCNSLLYKIAYPESFDYAQDKLNRTGCFLSGKKINWYYAK